MHKKITYLSALGIFFLFLSCQKKTDTSSNQSFSLAYTDTLAIGSNCDATFVASISFSGSPATLSISGLPSKVSVSPSSLALTTGSSSAYQFVFSCNNMTSGIYPIQINITNPTGTKSYNLYLKVLVSPNFIPQLANNYNNNNECGFSGSSVVTASGTNNSTLSITNLDARNDGLNVNANLTIGCSADTLEVPISIPLQTVNGITTHGSGTCYNEEGRWYIYIVDTTSSASAGTSTCTIEMVEQL